MKLLSRYLLFLITVYSGYSAAQTVCSGDSVVVVLTGHKQGSTVWEQSSDRTTWSPAQGAPYNDSLVIIAGNTLYYRAIVTDGTCNPYYSDTTLITVRPVPPPIANPASNITLISFDANWAPSPGATKYYLDVAADAGFTSFVSGYNNLVVNNKTTYSVIGVSCNTPYYYRVRVYDDSCGTTSMSSNTITVTTLTCPAECTIKSTCSGNITDSRDSKTYKTVQIGSQCWMAQNLNVGKRIDGIKQQTPGLDNKDTSIEKYCYSDVPAKCDTFGGMYLWDEMMAYDSSRIDSAGPQGICPTGWHVPTDNEWKCLEITLGMSKTDADKNNFRGTTEGGKLMDTTLWKSSSGGGATNLSGFSALPGGYHVYPGYTGSFFAGGGSAYIWTATENNAATSWGRHLDYNNTKVDRNSNYKLYSGYSVRCVKD